MALTSLMPSPTLKSAFSPYTDSPSSPAPYSVSAAFRQMQRGSSGSGSDKDSLVPPPSPYPLTVDPSPVESNNSASTDATEIEDEPDGNDEFQEEVKSPDIEIMSPHNSVGSDSRTHSLNSPGLGTLAKVDISAVNRLRNENDDTPASVIHAPPGFSEFVSERSASRSRPPDDKRPSPPPGPDNRRHSLSAPSEVSEPTTVVSPITPDSGLRPNEKWWSKDTAPINTQVPPASRHGAGSTPRASTKQEAEEEWKRRQSMRSGASNYSPDGYDDPDAHVATMGEALRNLNTAEQEIDALKTALSECWTLCNTLAGLSSIHRERMFSFSGTGDVQEQAWKSCWRLCQKLYESRDEDHASQVKPTLELCRDFCQALFEARHRGDEITDSILRVSFELNNHLYNTHDRNLPDVFQERTLDFYLTMCHRLMKQRAALPEETDALLRACWSLAEMLFSLRQNNRDHKPVDEELLGSAVQACWDLCDLFREGWTQVRPDRGTPRPVQRSVFPTAAVPVHERSTSRPPSSLSVEGTFGPPKPIILNPETPTTVFDDQDDDSPSDPQVPNILVLGLENHNSPPLNSQRASNHVRYSSNSSVTGSVSGYSDRTAKTGGGIGGSIRAIAEMSAASSTHSMQVDGEDPHLVRLKGLIVKAANNLGFQRQSLNSLPAFVKTLPQTAFGNQAWQIQLFDSYRKLILTDPTLRDRALLPTGRKFSSTEMSRAVQWMTRAEKFTWFRDLYRLVFGFSPEAAKKTIAIQL